MLTSTKIPLYNAVTSVLQYNNYVVFFPATLVFNKMISLIVNWEWGTTENFLYRYPGGVSELPASVIYNTVLCFVDV